MSEALWAALAGGAQTLSDDMRQREKQRFLEELEKGREARREEYDIRKEERAEARRAAQRATEVAESIINPETGMVEMFNADKELIDSRPATETELRGVRRAEEKEDADNRYSLARALKTEAEAEFIPQKQSMEVEAHRANMGLRGAQTEAARARAEASRRSGSEKESDRPTTVSEMAQRLVDLYPDLVKQYTSGDEAILTMSQIHDLARRSALAALREGKDPADTWRRTLQNYPTTAAVARARREGSGGSGRKAGAL